MQTNTSAIYIPISIITFLLLWYLTSKKENRRIKFTMKLWKWIALLMLLNCLGYGLIVYDMYLHKIDNVTFNGVGTCYFIGYILVLGPGVIVFYMASALLSIITPEKIRGIMFAANTLFGAVLVLIS